MKCSEEGKITAVNYTRSFTVKELADRGSCEIYGVVGLDETDKVVVSIPDVSSKAEVVDRLVDLLNRCEVSRFHAKEVVEDFVAVL